MLGRIQGKKNYFNESLPNPYIIKRKISEDLEMALNFTPITRLSTFRRSNMCQLTLEKTSKIPYFKVCENQEKIPIKKYCNILIHDTF